ncbi:MAG: IS4 family transposase [Chlamydiales bacterium]
MKIHFKQNDCKAKHLTQKNLVDLSRNVLKNISKVLLKREINDLAYASGFIKRSSSKITGFEFLTSMLVASSDSEQATLEKISDLFRAQFKVKIRAQSIMERLNNESAVNFLKDVFEAVLNNHYTKIVKETSPQLLVPFSKILIQDSTRCDLNQKLWNAFKGSGGRASKSSLKLDVIYDFKIKKFESITLHNGSIADQSLAHKIIEHITPNTLIIRDMGYLRVDCISSIVEAKAFFLSRMKNNMCVYLNEQDTEPLDLAKYLHENFRKAEIVERMVYITADKVAVRLVAYRVPPEIAAKRRRTAHTKAKKEGRTLTQRSLTLLDFSLFITNVLAEIWPVEIIGTIYRIRWQIELMYKDWKERLKIDCLLGINHFRIRCLVYSRLIFILLINEVYKLFDYIGEYIGREVSMHKVYSWVKSKDRILRVLSGRFSWWEERYLDELIFSCMSHQKRKRKTSLQSIYEQDYYYSKVS